MIKMSFGERDSKFLAGGLAVTPTPSASEINEWVRITKYRTQQRIGSAADSSQSKSLGYVLQNCVPTTASKDGSDDQVVLLGDFFSNMRSQDWRAYGYKFVSDSHSEATSRLQGSLWSFAYHWLYFRTAVACVTANLTRSGAWKQASANMVLSFSRQTAFDGQASAYSWTDHPKGRAMDMDLLNNLSVRAGAAKGLTGHTRVVVAVLDFMEWFATRYGLSFGMYQSLYETTGTSNWHNGWYDLWMAEKLQSGIAYVAIDCDQQGRGGTRYMDPKSRWPYTFSSTHGVSASIDARRATILLSAMSIDELYAAYGRHLDGQEESFDNLASKYVTATELFAKTTFSQFKEKVELRQLRPTTLVDFTLPSAWAEQWVNAGAVRQTSNGTYVDNPDFPIIGTLIGQMDTKRALDLQFFKQETITTPNSNICSHLPATFPAKWESFIKSDAYKKFKSKTTNN